MPNDTEKSVVPIPASTVLLIRDIDDGLEVFMVERSSKMHFASALVFPGGMVDPEDSEAAVLERTDGIEGLSAAAAALRIAAVRETFEESGVVLARHAGVETVLEGDEAAAFYEKYHAPLNAGDVDWPEIVVAEDLILSCDRLAYFAHWITPEGRPKRFDTHFFLARMPRRQNAVHDGGESVHSVWVRPADGRALGESGERNVMFPTQMNLSKLSSSETVDAAIEAANANEVVTVQPKPQYIDGDRDRVMAIPAEAGYGAARFRFTDNKLIPVD